ncbi:MAG: DUF2520 domain-containing protein [Flavobacteriaceae bacterium]|nr:DUF2520 domain-containing protein [Bacteroidia bacterium]NNL16432.1 DUF2520 domain-containing protein [Flavobacteriaceae bacterium]
MISVIILGSGNVATHLFKAFNKADKITVKQWFSRTQHSIEQFKDKVEITNNYDDLKEADVYILAVSDDAIHEVSAKLTVTNKFIVHTSGAMTLHEMDKKNDRGVFYPLQTFSKDVEMDFANVPFCLEVENKSNMQILNSLCEAIGSKYYRVNSEQRSSLHLAAVFVNNFVNQLYRTAHEITESTSVDFNILKPLIIETAKKIENLSPYRAQTGPAKRHDKKTIKKHMKLLQNDQHKEIYDLLTKVIQRTHGKKL